jgi:hypothetical protein
MDSIKTAISLVLIGAVAIALVWRSADAFRLRSPVFAFLANRILMSWVAFNGKLVKRPMPDIYSAPYGCEQSGRIYELLGNRLFKAMGRRGLLAIFSPTLKFPKEKSPKGMHNLEEEGRKRSPTHPGIGGDILSYFSAARLCRCSWIATNFHHPHFPLSDHASALQPHKA